MDHYEQILDSIYLAREPEYGRWESIETAPKDGSLVLIAIPGWERSIIASYDLGGHSWHREFMRSEPEPTHWMPLPRLPESPK